MRVAKDRVVSLQVEVSDIWGNLIDQTDEPVEYLHGGYGDIFPAVEAALEGKSENERVAVRLEPEDAFGDYDESLLRVESREAFPETLEVGMRFEGMGDPEDHAIYTVTDIAGGKVILDGNHPLSGMALKFVTTIVAVRPATADELENGCADDASAVVFRPLT